MMSMGRIAYWEGMILLGGFCVIIVWKLLTGGMRLDGLFQGDHRDGSTRFSPGRVQLLIFTIMIAVQYLIQVIQHPNVFPQIPQAWLAVLGGSQTVYLGGKARAMLFGEGPK
jgi:hypothetical protein